MQIKLFDRNGGAGAAEVKESALFYHFTIQLDHKTETPVRVYAVAGLTSAYLGIPDRAGRLAAQLARKHLPSAPECGVVTDEPRGVWQPWRGELDGVPFGWNIGYGFGNTAAASENVLFYDGRIHKLGTVEFHIPKDEKGRNAYLNVWNFTSDDNRFYMDFTPVLDRSALTSAIIIKSDQHQVFGRFTGRVTLDDGTVLPVRDFFGFAEKVENKW